MQARLMQSFCICSVYAGKFGKTPAGFDTYVKEQVRDEQ